MPLGCVDHDTMPRDHSELRLECCTRSISAMNRYSAAGVPAANYSKKDLEGSVGQRGMSTRTRSPRLGLGTRFFFKSTSFT